MTPALLLISLSSIGYHPLVRFVNYLKGDKLSPEFTRLLEQGQVWLGISLMVACCALLTFFRLMSNRPFSKEKWMFYQTLLFVSMAAGVLSGLVQAFVFDNLPHITDATSHVFQAKIMATGRLAVENPPCYEAFFQHNVIIGKSGLWHSKYFPGQALWLTPGFVIHTGWLMMPLGWSLTVFSFGMLIRRFYSQAESILAAFLFALSPLGLLVSASFMSHSTFLMYLLGALAVLVHILEKPSRHMRTIAMISSGFLAGMAMITRPQDLIPYAAGLTVVFILLPWSVKKQLFQAVPILLAGGLIPAAFLLYWNQSLYGSWLSSGYHFGESISLTPIIQDSLGFNEQHTPARAVFFTGLTLYRFDGALNGWPTSLLFCTIPFFRRSWQKTDIVCLIVIIATVVLYMFFHYLGFELEARYYTPALPPSILLVTRGLFILAGAVSIRIHNARTAVIASMLIGLFVYSFGHYWPHYLWPKYAYDYEQVSANYHKQAKQWLAGQPEAPLLVLIEQSAVREFHYSSGFVFNDPGLEKPILYARYRPDLISCLRQAFPNRKLLRLSPEGTLSEIQE